MQGLAKRRSELVVFQAAGQLAGVNGNLLAIHSEGKVTMTSGRIDLRVEYMCIVNHRNITRPKDIAAAELVEAHLAKLDEIHVKIIVFDLGDIFPTSGDEVSRCFDKSEFTAAAKPMFDSGGKSCADLRLVRRQVRKRLAQARPIVVETAGLLDLRRIPGCEL